MSDIMPNPASRRALLKGAASLAALAAPLAPALASPVASAHPDAGLLALGQEWKAATDAYRTADALSDAGWAEWKRTFPATPEALLVRERDRDLGMLAGSELEDGRLWYGPKAVDRLRARKPGRAVPRPVTPADNLPPDAHTYVTWLPIPEGVARAEEVIAAHDAWMAECNAIKAALDLNGLDARLDEACGQVAALGDRIIATPASTLAGFMFKARIALWHTREMLDPAEMEHACSVELLGAAMMRDLIALAGQEA